MFNAIEKVTKMLDDKDEKARKYRNIERAKSLKSDKPEELFLAEETVPLDKSLIDKTKVNPLDLEIVIETEKQKQLEKQRLEKQKLEKIKQKALEEARQKELERQKALKAKEEAMMETLTVEPKPKKEKVVKEEPLIIEKPVFPKEEVIVPVLEKKEEKNEELISGLVIMNLYKTINAIHNIKRIYTM